MKRLAIASIGLLALACGGTYAISVTNAGDALDNGTDWELAIVRGGCEPEFDDGADAAASGVARILSWKSGEDPPSVGTLASGRYGFYLRVRDGCERWRWAGCAPLDAQAGGSGDVQIPLRQVEGPPCDDGDACTEDACDLEQGCLHSPLDANACNDGDACTADTCDPASGCGHSPLDGDGDGMVCADDCDDQISGPGCDDGDHCTEDSCEEGRNCAHLSFDGDGDGDGVACVDDCDDGDPDVSPWRYEHCNDKDDDCDGVVDDDFAACGDEPPDDECREVGNDFFGPFLVCEREVSWEEAIVVCERNGGVLASRVPDIDPKYLPDSLPGTAWIAFNDRFSEGEWVGYDGQEVTPRWAPGEPEDPDGGHCVLLNESLKMLDARCEEVHASLCALL